MFPSPVPFPEPVYVTRPLLPPLEEFTAHLSDIWRAAWLTNNGAKHTALEQALGAYLHAQHLSLFNNGTIALIVACRALRLAGEVITTPFTFPATPHVLSWNNITPVFADIDPTSMTIDPAKIVPLITARTTAILGVHVYGIPCDVQAIDAIAESYGLRVIYDAAHAFGTEIDQRPITAFGDVTMLSFHATKLFHTAEGGALVVRDAALKHRIDLLKNFGIKNEEEVVMPGINGKMTELQAAMGLAVLRYIDSERDARARIAKIYQERLGQIAAVSCVAPPQTVRNSYQYFIIRIKEGAARKGRDQLCTELKRFNIFTRKYFYPLASSYSCYSELPSAVPEHLPNAHRAASEVLALPIYGALGEEGADRVCDTISFLMGS